MLTHSSLGGALRRVIVAALIACLVTVASGTAANASTGSDSPTPYTVTKDGIQLPAGDTFPDGGHVNIRVTGSSHRDLHFEDKCITRTDAECAGDRHAAAQYIGKNFIPWSAFGLKKPFCVTWVQIAHYEAHFGEGGQSPVCVDDDTPPEPPMKPDVIVEKKQAEGAPNCELKTVTTTFFERTIDWSFDDSQNKWVKSEPSVWKVVKTDTRTVTEQECPTPEEPPTEIDLPKPAFEDPCGPNNAAWKDQVDTDVLTWKVDDQGNLVATIIKDKVVFHDGTTSHNFGKAPESGKECPPEVVISPSALIEVLCDGSGSATLDNSKSTASVGFEVVVNGVATLYSVEAGEVMMKAISGATPGSQVLVQDGEANELASANVPDKCDTPIPPKPEPIVTETSSTSYECGDDSQTINRTVTTTNWVFDEKTSMWIKGEPTIESFTETVMVDVVPCATPPEKPTPPMTPSSSAVLPDTGAPELTAFWVGASLLLLGGLMVTRRRKTIG